MRQVKTGTHGGWILLGLWMTAIFGVAGCEQFAVVSESIFMMSPQQEIQLGEKIADQVEQDLEFVEDSAVNRYVQALGRKIWQHSPESAIDARFHVVADPEINAFAIPGGNVYVQTGLIQAADDEAELAAVIAHEVGHVVMRHGARHISHSQGLELVQQVLLGEESEQAAQLVASIISQGVMFNYSRQDEREADRIAVYTLNRAAYDPLALRTFFVKLKSRYGEQGGPIASFFSSHPPTSERMNNVTQLVEALPNPVRHRPVTELRRVQGRLEQLGYTP